MNNRASTVYAAIIALLGLSGVVIGFAQVFMATSGNITPRLP